MCIRDRCSIQVRMTPRQARLGTSRRRNYCSTWQDKARTVQSENGARSYAQAESAKHMLSFANPRTGMKKTNDHNDWWLPARRPLSTFRAKSMAVEVSPRKAAHFAESTFQPIIVLFSYQKKYICLLCLAWHIVQEASPCHGRRRGTFTMIVFKQSMDMSAR